MQEVHRLKKLAEKMGLSVRQLAFTSQIPPSSLQAAINKGSKVTRDISFKIVKAHPNVNEDWLLEGTGEMFNEDNSPTKSESGASRFTNRLEVGRRLELIREKLGFRTYEGFGIALGKYVNSDGKPVKRSTIEALTSGMIQIPDDIRNILVSQYRVNALWLDYGQGDMFTHDLGEDEGSRIRNKKAVGPSEDKGLLFVPIKAQAGYALQFNNDMYLEQLERVFIPGMPYEGEKFRIFEVNGDSMEPTFQEGFFVIAERVEPENFKHTAQYYVYVVITETQMLIKRLYRTEEGDYVLISDNEEYYPQQYLAKEEVKELWLVKRKMDWNMPPPKKFEITAKKPD